jgi:hypothetical protein
VIRPDIAFRTRSTAYHPDIDRIRAVPQESGAITPSRGSIAHAPRSNWLRAVDSPPE